MKASDRKRVREMEKEWVDCYLDRYHSDQWELYRQNPDLESLRKELAEYVESQKEHIMVPTYFHYWEEEEARRRVWILLHDPIGHALFKKLLKAEKDIIDSKNRVRRMKRVGDGTHSPVKEEDAEAEAPSSQTVQSAPA